MEHHQYSDAPNTTPLYQPLFTATIKLIQSYSGSKFTEVNFKVPDIGLLQDDNGGLSISLCGY